MTAWLNRAMAAEGRPPVSKHTVHRLMSTLGMNGLVRGRKTRTTVPDGKDARRAGDLLNRQFSAPRPNHAWVADFVRHEAPWIRVEVRDLHRRVVAAIRSELRAV